MIMGDDYWNTKDKTVIICTENFILEEINIIINLLNSKLNLKATTNKRYDNSWIIRFSRKKENIDLLRSLVKPHIHPDILYKLGI